MLSYTLYMPVCCTESIPSRKTYQSSKSTAQHTLACQNALLDNHGNDRRMMQKSFANWIYKQHTVINFSNSIMYTVYLRICPLLFIRNAHSSFHHKELFHHSVPELLSLDHGFGSGVTCACHLKHTHVGSLSVCRFVQNPCLYWTSCSKEYRETYSAYHCFMT